MNLLQRNLQLRSKGALMIEVSIKYLYSYYQVQLYTYYNNLKPGLQISLSQGWKRRKGTL
jgi:hypothetical protein